MAEHKDRIPAVLDDPFLNRGVAFTQAERQAPGLTGRLPAADLTLEEQARRACGQLQAQPSDLAQNVYLEQLHDRDEVLYYQVLADYLAGLLPIVYDPTVGEAIGKYSHEYRRPRGIFLSIGVPPTGPPDRDPPAAGPCHSRSTTASPRCGVQVSITSSVAPGFSRVMTAAEMSARNRSPPGPSSIGPARTARPAIFASPGHSASWPGCGWNAGPCRANLGSRRRSAPLRAPGMEPNLSSPSANSHSMPEIRGEPSARNVAIVLCLPAAKSRRTRAANSGSACSTSCHATMATVCGQPLPAAAPGAAPRAWPGVPGPATPSSRPGPRQGTRYLLARGWAPGQSWISIRRERAWAALGRRTVKMPSASWASIFSTSASAGRLVR